MTLEKGVDDLFSSPLNTFHLYVPTISKLQGYAFTAIDGGDTNKGPTFLFRRSPARKTPAKADKEWTWQLAALSKTQESIVGLKVECLCYIQYRGTNSPQCRIEEPYSPPVSDLLAADHVLLLVGGSGVTGAIAIARWFILNFGGAALQSKSLELIWTVRDQNMARLAEVDEIQALARSMSNLQVSTHVSSKTGRLSPHKEVERFMSARQTQKGRHWVYASGPAGLLEDAETACIRQRQLLGVDQSGEGKRGISWYIAHFTT